MTYDNTLDWMQQAFRAFAAVAIVIRDEDVQQARKAVNAADVFGSFLDPTRYQQAQHDRRLERQRRLIDLFDHTTREWRLLEDWPASGAERGLVHTRRGHIRERPR